MKTRKDLPPVARTCIQADLPGLLAELRASGLLETNMYRDFDYSEGSPLQGLLGRNLDMRRLAMTEQESAKCVVPTDYRSEGYRQLSLTEAKIASNEAPVSGPITARDRIKRLKRDSKFYDPIADERNYGRLKDIAGPELRRLLDRFEGILCRVRLAVLMPGAEISPHRDYDPSYLVRYHIPIVTNEQSAICFRVGDTITKYRFEADGFAYFLNTGLIHWVENRGQTARIHLIVDIDGQKQLDDLQAVESPIHL